MRKSSSIILLINIISILIGMYFLRFTDQVIANYAIDSAHHIPMSKGNLILIGLVPFIVVFTMDIIATLEADEVKPFIKYYDRLKFMLCFAFQLLFILIIMSQFYSFTEKYIIGTIFTIVVLYGGYTLPKITLNQVVGFKNKWTLSSEQIWNKVHIRGRSLSYLIGAFVLVLTYTKNTVMVVAVLIVIAVSIIYLTYYSYSLYKKEPGL
ncbi:SdpI family protein [Mollicutes bacterium LVI A0078]|nr:SdpI family protein [Mollicutes bacterium LVI A0075]WOO91138.1 SdpI family protein [Mollicutes bacterium LVI A0078]